MATSAAPHRNMKALLGGLQSPLELQARPMHSCPAPVATPSTGWQSPLALLSWPLPPYGSENRGQILPFGCMDALAVLDRTGARLSPHSYKSSTLEAAVPLLSQAGGSSLPALSNSPSALPFSCRKQLFYKVLPLNLATPTSKWQLCNGHFNHPFKHSVQLGLADALSEPGLGQAAPWEAAWPLSH